MRVPEQHWTEDESDRALDDEDPSRSFRWSRTRKEQLQAGGGPADGILLDLGLTVGEHAPLLVLDGATLPPFEAANVPLRVDAQERVLFLGPRAGVVIPVGHATGPVGVAKDRHVPSLALPGARHRRDVLSDPIWILRRGQRALRFHDLVDARA